MGEDIVCKFGESAKSVGYQNVLHFIANYAAVTWTCLQIHYFVGMLY